MFEEILKEYWFVFSVVFWVVLIGGVVFQFRVTWKNNNNANRLKLVLDEWEKTRPEIFKAERTLAHQVNRLQGVKGTKRGK